MFRPGRALLVPVLALAIAGMATGPVLATGTPSPSPSPSPSASGPVTKVTYGLGPSTNGTFDRRPGFNFLSTRGTPVTDEVTVINLADVPLTLNLYAVDALNGPDGTLGLKAAAEPLTGAAAWVRLDTPTGKGFVTLAPRQQVAVPFSVAIPTDARVGDHLAGIVVSTVAAGATPGDRGTAVELEQRVAVPLSVRVAGALTPALAIENLSARYVGSYNPVGSGTAVLRYSVRNTGNVRLGGVPRATIEGLLGAGASTSDLPEVPALLPGSTVDFEVAVQDVSPSVVMTARIDLQPVAPAQDPDPGAPAVSASTTFLAVPWLLFALLLTIALGVGWWLRRRRASALAEAPDPRAGRRGRADLIDA